MPYRFFADNPLTSDTVQLDQQEARHLRDAMRLKVGDVAELFNGHGTVAAAKVSKVAKRIVELRIQSRQTEQPAVNGLVIASAVPKGDRFRWMIEKMTELNVSRFIPLRTYRGVVSPRDTKLERMKHVVIAASKQCGRNFLMTIDPVTGWEQFVAENGKSILLADPVGPELHSLPGEILAASIFAIGPEGGFTDEETQVAIAAGATSVRFVPTILRVETAAIAAAALGNAFQKDG